MNRSNSTISAHLPDGLGEAVLALGAERLHEVMPGLTLVDIPGRRADCIFLSVLLHGNETSGWETVRALLARHAGQLLPRSVCLLIGNVGAAREGRRHLPGEPDYNRIWRGGDGVEQRLATRIVDLVRARRPFCAIDIHNNTGRNPHYACVTRLAPEHLHLATLFARTVVYFNSPDTVITRAVGEFCPAVTLECGLSGTAYGTLHALDHVAACLHLDHLPSTPVAHGDIDLFHTVGTLRVPDDIAISVDGGIADLSLNRGLDELNFRELPAGTAFGRLADPARVAVTVSDESGADVTARYFSVRGSELVTRTPVMPAMLTCNPEVIRQDCLGYLMERWPLA